MLEVAKKVRFDSRDWWMWPLRVVDLQVIIEQARADFIRAATLGAVDKVSALREATFASLSIHLGSTHWGEILRDPGIAARCVWLISTPVVGSEVPTQRRSNSVPFEQFMQALATDADGVIEACASAVASCGFLRPRAEPGVGIAPQAG